MRYSVLACALSAMMLAAAPALASAGHAVPRPPILSCKNGKAPLTQQGLASWYGAELHGEKTASGEIFNKLELTAAHRTLPMHALVQVVDLKSGNAVIVRVNDRGPFKPGRIIDVSAKAAEILGIKARGIAQVAVRPCLEYVLP